MATTIKLKNSVTTTNTPTSLVQGEVAINITDKKVWVGNAATTPIQLLGDGASLNFTSLSLSGNLTFTGTGNRITGDFSNATFANRVAFQTSTTNGNTTLSVIPNGTGTASQFWATGGSDIGNSPYLGVVQVGTTDSRIQASIQGTASYTPMTFYTGGSERLRIDTSGNVLIGTTTLIKKLTVSGEIATTDGTTNVRIGQSGGVGLVSTLTNHPMAFQTNDTERMRITSGGLVGIGLSSPTYRLQVAPGTYSDQLAVFNEAGTWTSNGGVVIADYYDNTTLIGGIKISASTATSGFLTFHTGGTTERMRITTDGALLVGTITNTDNYLTNIQFSGSATNGLIVKNTASTGAPTLLFLHDSAQTLNNATDSAYYTDSTATRWTLRKNGGLANYQANDVNLSDEREKTNIELAGSYLDKICAIPVKTFNYIDQNREEDDGLTLGVIAQDVQAVAPELVMESDWSVKRDGSKMRLSIYQTDLQYALMKCIQEQQAMIVAMQKEIAELKVK